jgi:hypothetical protein
VTVVDLEQIVRGEYDENVERLPLQTLEARAAGEPGRRPKSHAIAARAALYHHPEHKSAVILLRRWVSLPSERLGRR